VASRWPVYPAAALAGLGLIIWLGGSGVLASVWFPLLLILLGAYLLLQERRGEWVEVTPPDETAADGQHGEPEESAPPAEEQTAG